MLENLISKSNVIIENTIAKYRKTVAIFYGDKESTLLADILSNRDIPFIFLDKGLHHDTLYKYIDEAGPELQIKIIHIKIGQDYEIYLNNFCKAKGIEAVFFQRRYWGKTKLHLYYKEVFPLSCFKDIDIWRYIRERRLPYCKLYDAGFKEIVNPITDKEKDTGEILRRLKALGYL
jgi:3'-phosphoadenosine 5'-phosphosulfate sulfotransferase (PAPS reductase)/FAD synthetase